MILNPYKYVPLTELIKLEINYSNKLENICNQDLSLMELKDTFTIQEINLDKKDLSYENKLKEIEAYLKQAFAKQPSKTIAKFFVIKN